jgi:hypothetical protein
MTWHALPVRIHVIPMIGNPVRTAAFEYEVSRDPASSDLARFDPTRLSRRRAFRARAMFGLD